MHLDITALYLAILIIMQVLFTFAVIQLRLRHKVSLGDGNHSPLNQRIRAHANFVEVVPLTIMAIGILEYMGVSHSSIHIFGSVLVVSRILHYIGLVKPRLMKLRQLGMVGSVVVMLTAAFGLIFKVAF